VRTVIESSDDLPRDRERGVARHSLLEQLRELVADGAPLPATALPKELYGAILTHFGSIADARRAAGLSASLPARRRWSEEAVIEELRRLHGLGLSIRDRDLKDAGYSGVVEAAQVYCGGLARARRLARIAIARRIPRQRSSWDAERVVAEIRALRAAGRPLARSKVDARLYLAARRYFGSWGEAVDTAGVDYGRVRLHAPSQPVEQLLEQLRALAAELPELTVSQLEAHPLGYTLRRRFSSLAAAVRAAGIVHWPRRARNPVLTAAETLAAVRARGALGSSMVRRAVRREDGALVRAAERHFGSWRQALAAAGLAPR